MLSTKAQEICAAQGGYKGCDTCPLYPICGTPNDEMPGATIEEKSAWWIASMNAAAEEAKL